MPDLETTLKTAIRNLRSGNLEREENVKIAVILPILDALGWNFADPDSLRPEYPAGPGRVDYALLCHGRPLVFVEAKRRGAVGVRAEAQLFDYAANNGVPLLVLSDGLRWDFYLSMADGRPEERCFDRLELRDEDSVSQYARTLESCLHKQKVTSGEARRGAEYRLEDERSSKRAWQAMPDAWNALLDEPDELLCELLTDKVEERSGVKPRPADVEEFLRRFLVAPPSSMPEIRQSGNAGGNRQVTTAAVSSVSSVPPTEATERGENLQDIVKDLMRCVLEDFPGTLDENAINHLESAKNPLGLKIGNLELIRKVAKGRYVGHHNRYWKHPFAGRWYVCAQWWRQDHRHNARKLSIWVSSLIADTEDPRARGRLQDILNRLSAWGE